ncbi:hypothetical protein B4113_4073 [Geobacillus sp. B4113_201601]|nr:hypothetical protein B4113_4073 [Geobacillus sp. B4113_201601]
MKGLDMDENKCPKEGRAMTKKAAVARGAGQKVAQKAFVK